MIPCESLHVSILFVMIASLCTSQCAFFIIFSEIIDVKFWICICVKNFCIRLTHTSNTFFVAKYCRAKKPKYKVKQILHQYYIDHNSYAQQLSNHNFTLVTSTTTCRLILTSLLGISTLIILDVLRPDPRRETERESSGKIPNPNGVGIRLI